MPSKVTIATVARHANVSRQTVSNVLNAPDMVREETRARVIAAIKKLGYRTNLAARQMRTGRSRLIGVRIDPVRNGIEAAVLDRFLHGLTQTAAPAGPLHGGRRRRRDRDVRRAARDVRAGRLCPHPDALPRCPHGLAARARRAVHDIRSAVGCATAAQLGRRHRGRDRTSDRHRAPTHCLSRVAARVGCR